MNVFSSLWRMLIWRIKESDADSFCLTSNKKAIYKKYLLKKVIASSLKLCQILKYLYQFL